jgi:dTMP kinase
MNSYPGKFITLEGTEGAGKSTNLIYIEQWLSAKGVEVVTTREPGGTKVGEEVRAILLNTDNQAMTADTELMLMFAARNQHLQEKILPALKAGKWVISDRFTDASYAYQGAARGIEYKRILELEQWVQQGFHPNMTFVFDLSVEEGMKRVKARGEVTDRFEEEKQTFFEKVRSAYINRANQSPSRYTILDASQKLENVQQQIDKTLLKLINTASNN